MAFAQYFSAWLVKHATFQISRVASLKFSKNNLRDDGIRELSKAIKISRSLVDLDVSSNGISPRGMKYLQEAILENNSICVLNVSTVNGINRNRVQTVGGQSFAEVISQ